jgi:hypothetical protein
MYHSLRLKTDTKFILFYFILFYLFYFYGLRASSI